MIKRYLPSFIVKGNIIKDIFESQQAEVDLLNNNIQDLIDNLFVETATWSLVNWEKEYNIPIDLDDTLENRRSRILARMVSKGQPFTKETIEAIANQFTNGTVEVIEHLEDDYFTVKFVSAKGIPPKIQDVYDAINEVKASWLDIDYEFIFNTVHYLRQYTVRELRQYTVEELRIEELKHLVLKKYYLTDKNGINLVDKENNKLIASSQDLDLSKKYLTDGNGNKLVDGENNKLNTF